MEERIIEVLNLQAIGEPCRLRGNCEAALYSRKAKYEALTMPKVRRLRALEEENRMLKKLLAKAMLNSAATKEAASGNF